MAGHGPKYSPHGPVPFPHISRPHRYMATFLGATMWFWVLYRVREEGPVLLGWRHPWEHAGHGHEHQEGHGDTHAEH